MSHVRSTFLKSSELLRKRNKYDVIIVGGGHNGLVAAFYLSKAKKKVCVLERRHVLGGAAVTEEIVPGFKFSRASYVLGLLRPHIIRDMDLKRHGLKVFPRDPSSYTPLHQSEWKHSGATSLTLGLDHKKNFEQVKKFSLTDAESLPKYEAMLNGFAEALGPLLDTPPPDLKEFAKMGLSGKLAKFRDFFPLYGAGRKLGTDLPSFLNLLMSPSEAILNQWFESEPLKATLATDSVIGTMASPKTPGTGYVLLHHVMAETNGVKGAWSFPQGGMGAVTQAMASAAAEAGADLFVEQNVKEILLDSNRKARGVKVDDNQTGDIEVVADVILSNATPKVTFRDLLCPRSLPKEFLKRIEQMDFTSPVCKINVALSRIPNFVADPNEGVVMPHHQCTIHLNCEETRFIDDAFVEARRGLLPSRPFIEMTFPSSCDQTLCSKGAHVALMFTQYVPNTEGKDTSQLKALKEAYVQKVFDSVEEYAPGFKSSIVGYEALMPWDLEKEFNLTGGNIFHGSMSLHQLFTGRPSAERCGPSTPINGLYLCGAGAHPGGGVMGAPGFIASSKVIKDFDKIKKTAMK